MKLKIKKKCEENYIFDQVLWGNFTKKCTSELGLITFFIAIHIQNRCTNNKLNQN